MTLNHRLTFDCEEVIEIALLVLMALVQLLLFESFDSL